MNIMKNAQSRLLEIHKARDLLISLCLDKLDFNIDFFYRINGLMHDIGYFDIIVYKYYH